jgi:Cys-rich protein (TIGR01571 family)
MWCAGDSSSAAAGYCGLEVLGFLFNNLKKQAGLGGRIVGSFGEAGVDVAEGSLVAVSRNRLRKKYSIREPDDCIHSDCFVAFCCSRCAMCQEEHEIHAREGTRRKPKTVLIAPASIQM